ncbi:nucleotidyltransferase domain-containing protein [Polynucleobacter sp. MWH-Loch1C5]|nr:nucleotidyltransferase domain-containing protein [Polynucleobacter sp. MWH-Loch1C5]
MNSPRLFNSLSLSAQTAYAELCDQLSAQKINLLGHLPGSFQRMTKRGRRYVYYNYRDMDGSQRMAYVGPESDRVERLIQKVQKEKNNPALDIIRSQAKACIALGCLSTLSKHFRVVNRLNQYGFFMAGATLIGTHAFLGMGNALGVAWSSAHRTNDIDFAHAGKNVSLALGANMKLSVHDALTSLEMGLLPITEFSGKTGAQYRNPSDPELRLDFLTSLNRSGEVVTMPDLGLSLQPMKFMEYSLESSLELALISNEGACLVNIPLPERYAIHKLIVAGERPVNEVVKSNKDIAQAAALFMYYLQSNKEDQLYQAWEDAIVRGPGWSGRLKKGLAKMLMSYPILENFRV